MLFKNMVEFEEIINTRRSIREYSDEQVNDEDILKILKAGMQAPGSRLGAMGVYCNQKQGNSCKNW